MLCGCALEDSGVNPGHFESLLREFSAHLHFVEIYSSRGMHLNFDDDLRLGVNGRERCKDMRERTKLWAERAINRVWIFLEEGEPYGDPYLYLKGEMEFHVARNAAYELEKDPLVQVEPLLLEGLGAIKWWLSGRADDTVAHAYNSSHSIKSLAFFNMPESIQVDDLRWGIYWALARTISPTIH